MKTIAPRFCYFLKTVALISCFAILTAGTKAQDRGLELSLTSQAGSYHALVIGNNAYQNIRKLKTAEADAKEVEIILRTQYGFKTKLLLNATREQIFTAFNSYRRELEPNTNLLIYYAGHGVNDEDINRAYWLPVDARMDNNSNWISADDITSNIRGIPAKHILIISDSCYSGTLTRDVGDRLPLAPSERLRYLQKMVAGKSRTLMASGGNEPVADGGGGNHSIFANALLRGLSQMDKGQFTANELFRNFVEESVAGRAKQTPEYNPLRDSGHESGDFVFVKIKAGDGKTVEVTVKTPITSSFDPVVIELSFWESIKNSTDPDDFKDYLDKYPNGQFTGLARRRQTALKNAATASSIPKTVPDSSTSDDAVSDSDSLTIRANELIGSKDYDEAIRVANEAIKKNRQDARAFRARGAAYAWLKNYDQGIRDYTEAIRLNPQYAEAYRDRGGSYGLKNNYEQAVKDYTEAIRINSQYGDAYMNRGVAYSWLKNYEPAIRDYTEAIRLDPKDFAAYRARGAAYAWLKNYAQAIRDYTEAIRLNPQYGDAYRDRGGSYSLSGNNAQALKDYTEAIRLNPTAADLYTNRGYVYEQLGDITRANADRQKAQELEAQQQ